MFRTATDKNYDVLFAENEFVTGLQLEIERAMSESDMTQADLARALDVSEARVSQILGGNGRNLQARTIARIAHILGLHAHVKFKQQESAEDCAEAVKSSRRAFHVWRRPHEDQGFDWDQIANDDELAVAA